jgi:hypothetical protein
MEKGGWAAYFQLREQADPNTLFAGTWQDISSSYAGLFFRVEGGNAASFGSDQKDNVGNHRHNIKYGNTQATAGNSYAYASLGNWAGMYYSENNHDYWEGLSDPSMIETRPVNTTIKIWKRVS